MKVGTGLSTATEARTAAVQATLDARRGLGTGWPSLALLFASPHHLAAPEILLDAVHDAAGPEALVGCVAEGVVGGAREVEGGPAVAVWLASLPAPAETFHMEFVRTESGGVLSGWRFDQGRGGTVHLMMCDPFTFPADLLLRHLNEQVPWATVVGGLAGGAAQPGQTVLFRDRTVVREGAVGVRLPEGVVVRTLVSQGCRPIGPALVVTRADRNVLLELAGRSALDRLKETVAALAPPDQELVSHGLHLGRVIDEYKPEHGQGDFLIRGVIGADPGSGAIALGDRVEVGETVRFHVRDAATADEELRSLLEQAAVDLPGRPAGALLFTCNGRGSRMFDVPDHDARLVDAILGAPALAGFFCAGELGPVGGKNFLHGFTASLAVFLEDGPGGERG